MPEPISNTNSIDPLDSSHPIENNDDGYLPPFSYNPRERLTGADVAADTINAGVHKPQYTDSRITGASSTPGEPEQPEKKEEPKKSPKEIWKGRAILASKFFIVYVKVFCLFVGILSVYWATLYRRPGRYRNMKFLVVTEDEAFTSVNGTNVPPFLGNAFVDMVTNNDTVTTLAHWDIVPISEFIQSALARNNTVQEEVMRKIHHQKYWAGVHIMPNSTQLIYESLASSNFSLVSSGEITQLVNVIYESGRHYSALNQYVSKHISQIEGTWLGFYASQDVYQPLVKNYLNDTQRANLLANNNTVSILTSKPIFNIVDMRPALSTAVLGPSELGLIYAQLFSFHQFNFSLEIYAYIRTRLKFKQYIIWKFLASNINCFVLSLVYSLITIAFQIPTNPAFGQSGFLVLWMFMFLFISASGAINENVVTVILAFNKKVLLPPWMIFNIVINISTTFAPFVLMPGVFRYGYGMPMYNAYEALKVVFFDTWKGNLGRNLGILVTWIVVMNVVLVFTVRWANKRTKRIADEAKEKKAEEERKKLEESVKEKAESGGSSTDSNEHKG
ncbi:uncharacterized protein RJT20DRAFT_219 [Scheffersomyces xylosifermentans]|uniref:uncharacterized protein n=1 Tax=Scheffersomyces xylosifermentans TaxID=1304137 RepID=UPI00315D9092